MTREERLEQLQRMLSKSEGQDGYKDRVEAIRAEIERLEAEQESEGED